MLHAAAALLAIQERDRPWRPPFGEQPTLSLFDISSANPSLLLLQELGAKEQEVAQMRQMLDGYQQKVRLSSHPACLSASLLCTLLRCCGLTTRREFTVSATGHRVHSLEPLFAAQAPGPLLLEQQHTRWRLGSQSLCQRFS
jgi:hypothetical protein